MITKAPKLSVVIAFYNMRREAKRTLFSLTTAYQTEVEASDYEVIVLDSNSPEPLDRQWVESIQSNFRYRYVETTHPTPCKAMNTGITLAHADHVVCMIDGARILSPGILRGMIKINSLSSNSFVQTITMHIGEEPQNLSVSKGYNQDREDQLLDSIDWKSDGYRLFDVSCLAGSSRNGYLHPIPESNCFSIPKWKLSEIGGFDTRFTTPGGGLVNHVILARIMADSRIEPYMLLGEANFHQFHGGVATNVPPAKHPAKIFHEEYERLYGEKFKRISRPPTFYGRLDERSIKCVVTSRA